MKKLYFIICFTLLVAASYCQDVIGSRVIAKNSLFVRDRWVDTVTVDTSKFLNYNRSVPTAGAVYSFVVERIAAGGGGGGGGTWGSITGTLSNQTDLQNALNLKAPLISPLFTTPRLNSTSTTGYVWTATDASGNGSFQALPSDNLIVQRAGSGIQTWYTSGDSLYLEDIEGSTFIDVTKTTDSTINVALSATGTPSASTYLRGDNTWATIGGGGITTLNTLTGATQTFSSTGITIASTGTDHAFSNNLITGISGGQTVIGGTASGNSLTFSSTSNATKGTFIWGTTAKMWFDEVNNKLYVGQATDLGIFGIQSGVQIIVGRGQATPISRFTFSNNTTGSAAVGIYTSTDVLQALYRASGPSIGTTLMGISKNNSAELLGNSGPLFLYGNNQPVYISSNTTAPVITLITAGRVGFNTITSPTAWVHLPAGTASASTAPLKLTSGTNLTTAEAGAFEYNGTNLFFTRSGTTRESVITANAVNSVSPTAPNRTITVVIDGTTYYISAKTTND